MPLCDGMNGNPVEIESAIGSGRRTEAGVCNEIVVVEAAEKLVVAVVVEQLERDVHFVRAEDGCRVENLPQSSTVCSLQRAEPHRGHRIQ